MPQRLPRGFCPLEGSLFLSRDGDESGVRGGGVWQIVGEGVRMPHTKGGANLLRARNLGCFVGFVEKSNDSGATGDRDHRPDTRKGSVLSSFPPVVVWSLGGIHCAGERESYGRCPEAGVCCCGFYLCFLLGICCYYSAAVLLCESPR